MTAASSEVVDPTISVPRASPQSTRLNGPSARSPWPGSGLRGQIGIRKAVLNMGTELQRAASRRISSRIQAFDRRAIKVRSRCNFDSLHESGENCSANRSRSESLREAGENEVDKEPSIAGDEIVERREIDLAYTIVRWSSQNPDYPASELMSLGGVWEAAPMHVTGQYVVMELEKQEPRCVRSISIGLPGTDCGPCQCRVCYSKDGPDGPWQEAWRFTIESKAEPTHKSVHDYNVSTPAEDFVDLLLAAFPGGLEEAWNRVLDVNRDGRLSYREFIKSFTQLQSASEANRSFQWPSDPQGLFSQLDLSGTGTVTLADLQHIKEGATTHPKSAWWKLLVHRNWGSMKRLQVTGPLKLCDIVEVRSKPIKGQFRDVFSSRMMGVRGCSLEATQNLTTAFTLESLGVDPKTIVLRKLAKKHNLSILDLEELNTRFREVDSNSSGCLEEPEFTKLVLSVHGARDISDIPKGRLHFYWKQADADHSGEVDFEEFIVFFKKYASDVDIRSMKTKPRKDLKNTDSQQEAPERN